MRRYSALLVLGLSLLTIGLTGCQQSSQSTQTNFKKASESSESYHAAQPAKSTTKAASSSQHFAQDFHPTSAQTERHGYVKSGNLTKRGQYTYDRVGTKQTLKQVHHPQTTLKSGGFTYKLTTVRVLKNVAQTADAKKMAAQALNLTTLKSPYYTLQVKFTITNHRHQALTTDGIQAIRLGPDQELNATNQLSDASAGQTIPGNGHLNTFATGLASQQQAPIIKKIKIAFAGAYSAKQKQVIKPSRWLTIAVN